ncbi:MAG TPA: polysaccharide biosynthesis tyrosine autokinase, partial [Burkholderiaceae bacterium]|nr:polysaccharide biosynthesis tyrosine autokinase [Burkholderiaceae bacterium]
MNAKMEAPELYLGDGQGLDGAVRTKSIGELIQDARNLSADDLDRIGRYQRENDLRFGEAAIALGLADTEDVLQALAQQFKYAYADEDARKAAPELVMLNQPFGHQAEAFRAIRSQILMRTQGEKGQRRPLAVVSHDTGDGKTFFCANLAVALAQLGGRTLVVDADLRGPRMHEVFKVPNTVGLSGLLSARRGEQVINPVNGVPNLFVLPVGASPPNPLELVEGPAFGMVLREVLTRFDHVIVDTPAGCFGSDGVVVASRCGSALVISRKDANKVSRLQELVSGLQAGQVR